jgi:predicted dienelactone hydrolase
MLAHCEEKQGLSLYCEEIVTLPGGPVDADPNLWNASYADARITHVVAVEPALVWGLGAAEIDGLIDNVSLIGLGADEDRMLATNFDESGLAKLLPAAAIDHITPAMHYSALPICKPMGEAILKEEGDDPICSDPEGTDRAAVHKAIIARIAGDLGL